MWHRDENRQTPLKHHPFHPKDRIIECMRTKLPFISAWQYTVENLKTSLIHVHVYGY